MATRTLSVWFVAFIWLAGCQDGVPRSAEVSQPKYAGSVASESPRADAADSRGAVSAIVTYAGNAMLLPAGAVVYVFARAPGTTMPVAVETFSPDQLPIEVTFEHPKAGIESVEVVARLSLTGSVRRNPGDPEVVSTPVDFSLTPEPLGLTIPSDGTIDFVPSDDEVFIDVSVTLALEVAAPPQTLVFVAAREASGLPVAVQKLTVADLPATVRLSDAQSMFQTNKLSQHDEISIVARVALSGQAVAEAGDWEGVVQSVNRVGLNHPVAIVINSQIK